jgi:hypothetical protein
LPLDFVANALQVGRVVAGVGLEGGEELFVGDEAVLVDVEYVGDRG